MKNLVAVRVNTGDIDKVSSALRKAGYNMDMMYFEEASRPVPVPATAIP
ncbi:hypothetical protein [Diaphorobacter aerolatus]|uniref:Uncharacterized protein n=1 Tax=Diaphorobacter aerolatus TaxID=1288495 RepID=A0A7H0GPS2_9BURK|nr:hypothetical protein [Diaphorobacter aerolatus]QNP50288.1 hypothetical protein H9K75_11200 [Diaphorobacter aerolatus]